MSRGVDNTFHTFTDLYKYLRVPIVLGVRWWRHETVTMGGQ